MPDIQIGRVEPISDDGLQYGVELELAVNGPDGSSHLHNTISENEGWCIGTDCSIRARFETPELRFGAPRRFEAANELLRFVSEAANHPEIETNRSCGLHIHVSPVHGRWTVQSVRRLMCLWNIYGPLVTNATALDRKQGQYSRPETFPCVSFRPFNSLYNFVTRFPAGNVGRYKALNVMPVTEKGSVEFRTWEATTNAEELMDHLAFVRFMAKAALSMTEDQVKQFMRLVNEGVKEYMRQASKLRPGSERPLVDLAATSVSGYMTGLAQMVAEFNLNTYIEKYVRTRWLVCPVPMSTHLTDMYTDAKMYKWYEITGKAFVYAALTKLGMTPLLPRLQDSLDGRGLHNFVMSGVGAAPSLPVIIKLNEDIRTGIITLNANEMETYYQALHWTLTKAAAPMAFSDVTSIPLLDVYGIAPIMRSATRSMFVTNMFMV